VRAAGAGVRVAAFAVVGMTAEARSLLAILFGPTAVQWAEGLSASGRSAAFSAITVADVHIDGQTRRVVVRMGSPDGPFHHPEDAARQLLWYARLPGLPNHSRVLSVGVKDDGGEWRELVAPLTVAVVEEFLVGTPYRRDLNRIRDRRRLEAGDQERARTLARYLAGIHQHRHEDADAYLRGLRELVGGMEGVMSVVAMYPPAFRFEQRALVDRLQAAVAERAIDLQYCDRPVADVHGDFHPGNILFSDDGQVRVVDRGRIECDEVAVDVGAVLMDFIALGLTDPDLRAPARTLAETFVNEYIDASGDTGVTTALPVHTAMRAAAAASPTFHPKTVDRTRIATLTAGIRILGLATLGPDNLGVVFAEPDRVA
jgi:hypothetical protein